MDSQINSDFYWVRPLHYQSIGASIRRRLAPPVLLIFLSLAMLGLLAACGDEATPTPVPVPPTVAATPTVHTVRVVQRAPTPTAEPGELSVRTPPTAVTTTLPLLAAHLARVQTALQQPVPILPLEEGLDDQQKLAQSLALQDARFQVESRAVDTQAALRSEIFGVYPVSAGDVVSATTGCQPGGCYRVEMYNYAYNAATIAYVDLTKRQVLAVNSSVDTQPDLPPKLVNIAREIAVNAPEVVAAWGAKPGAQEAVMAATKTALSKSRCERSKHLCVAPTFVKGEWALWAIVDLTEGTLVGVRWTTVGEVKATTITEKRLEDEVVSKKYCETTNQVEQDGWQLEYIITSSDGLRILNVRYQGQPVLDSAAVVDWHVSYSTREGFGYSDAIGCPTFSQAAVVAFNGPTIAPIKVGEEVLGFALTQDFRSEVWPQPCNYYYQNRYEFYRDGSFRPVMINLGRGCGNDGWYRPVLRLALAGDYTFATWDGSAWQSWQTERWQPPAEKFTPEGYQFRITNTAGAGYYLEPARGQFNDGGRGDNPFVYVTKRHPDREEGDADLITIGSCCNNDYQQGPEKFIEATPESIANTQLVVWYVAQMKNDNSMGREYCWADSVLENGVYVPKTYPCRAGPMIRPVQK